MKNRELIFEELYRIREMMGIKTNSKQLMTEVRMLLTEGSEDLLKAAYKKLTGLSDEAVTAFAKSEDELTKLTDNILKASGKNTIDELMSSIARAEGKTIDELSQESVEQFLKNSTELTKAIDDWALNFVKASFDETRVRVDLVNVFTEAGKKAYANGDVDLARNISRIPDNIKMLIDTPISARNANSMKNVLKQQQELLSTLKNVDGAVDLERQINTKLNQIDAFQTRTPVTVKPNVPNQDLGQDLIFPGFKPDFTNIKNGNNMAEYHNIILKAFQDSNNGVKDPFNIISRQGFEGIGIKNFREFIKNIQIDINAIKTYPDNVSKRQHIELLDKNEKNFLNYYYKEIEPYLPKNKTVDPGNITNKAQANSNIFPDYGISKSLDDQRRITKETTDALGALGKSLDELGYRVENLTINDVKKIADDGGHSIYEVTYPNGVKIKFWESSGRGRKQVNLSPRNAHLNAANSEGYFGPIIGKLDTSRYKWVPQPDGSLGYGNKEWYIKGEGWERGYGSEIIEDTGLWLKYLKDSGELN